MSYWSNWRRNPFTHSFSGVTKTEMFKVDASKRIKLSEYPLPGTVTVRLVQSMSDLAEDTVSYPPAANVYYVDYIPDKNYETYSSTILDREGTAEIYVNVAAGTWVFVRYTGVGKTADFDDIIKPTKKKDISYYTWYNSLNYTWANPSSLYNDRIAKAIYYNGDSQVYILSGGGLRLVDIYTTGTSNVYTWTAPASDATRRGHLALDSNGKFYSTFWNGSGYHTYSDYSGSVANYTTIGNAYSASVQVGDYMYYTVDGSSVLRRADLKNNTYRDITLPNQFQYGCAVYNGNGEIYLLGNRYAGYVGQNLKINIYDESYSVFSPSTNFTATDPLLINGLGYSENGIIYALANDPGNTKIEYYIYDTINNKAFVQSSGRGYAIDPGSGNYNFSNIYKSVSGCVIGNISQLPTTYEYFPSTFYDGASVMFNYQTITHPVGTKTINQNLSERGV